MARPDPAPEVPPDATAGAGAHDAGRRPGELEDARAKQRTALISVGAAIALVAIKLATGLATGSLAFVAEAAHSATDLVAALLTLFAVRVALRPPDRDHNYGHGKAEHLAALGESAFLLLIAAWIGESSVSRLVNGDHGHVDAAWWAILVLLVVATIDVSRIVASRRGARRHGSPALAANAVHFASDLAGTLAVLVGLLFVAAGEPAADAIAALIVALLVIGLALRLAWQSIQVLMDRTSADAVERIRAALEALEIAFELRRVRVRYAAGRHFADIVVGVAPDSGLGQAHAVADAVEDRVADALGDADVVVHVEPTTPAGGLRERATAAALTLPAVREVHNVRVMHVDGTYELSLHVKLPRELTLTEAHDVIEDLEQTIQAAVPELGSVHTHIEPLARTDWASTPPTGSTAVERDAIDAVVRQVTGSAPLSVAFRDAERGRVALVTITLPGDQPLPAAHRDATQIKATVRDRCPQLTDVIVHTEPVAAGASPAR